MKTVTLNTDAKMPLMGLGTFLSARGEVYQAVRWAIKLGYKHIDCASVYGNQSEIGQALHDAVAEGDCRREELFITSKLWNDSHQINQVRPALEKTLTELKLDYLDLYLIHWPVAQTLGTVMPLKDDDWLPLSEVPLWETWAEMEKLYHAGLVKAVGVSNFNEANLKALIEKTAIVPAVNQVECHPLLSQNELLEFCRKNNIVLEAYSPLGAQKSNEYILKNPIIQTIARRNRCTPAQVVLAWNLQRGIPVIPKSVHEERIRENYAALAVELDEADGREIDALNENERFFDGTSFENAAKGYAAVF